MNTLRILFPQDMLVSIILEAIKWVVFMVFGPNLGHVVEKVGVIRVAPKESIEVFQRKN